MRGDDDDNRWGPDVRAGVRAGVLALVLLLLAFGGYLLFSEFSGNVPEQQVPTTTTPATEEQGEGLALPSGSQPQISPDGSTLSFLSAPQGVLNIFVAPVGDPAQARAVTSLSGRGVLVHRWAFNGTHILFRREEDQRGWAFAVEVGNGQLHELTPFEGRTANELSLSPWHPDQALVGLLAPAEGSTSLYRINIVTGEAFQVEPGGTVSRYFLDKDFIVRAGAERIADGVSIFARREDSWERLFPWGELTPTQARLLYLGAGHDLLYMLDDMERSTIALTSIDLATGERFVLAAHDEGNITEVIANPSTNEIVAYAVAADGLHWYALDAAYSPDIERLTGFINGDFRIISQSLDNSLWIVAGVTTESNASYYLYDRNRGTLEPFLMARP